MCNKPLRYLVKLRGRKIIIELIWVLNPYLLDKVDPLPQINRKGLQRFADFTKMGHYLV